MSFTRRPSVSLFDCYAYHFVASSPGSIFMMRVAQACGFNLLAGNLASTIILKILPRRETLCILSILMISRVSMISTVMTWATVSFVRSPRVS